LSAKQFQRGEENMSSARKSYLAGAILGIAVVGSLLAASAAGFHRSKAASSGGMKRLGQVHGTVYAQLDPNGSHKIFLPDISVFLRDINTGKETEAVVSADDGRYSISASKPGNYQLCWKGQGWLAGCNARPIAIVNGQTKYPGLTRIQPDLAGAFTGIGPQRGVIAGRVTLANGARCQFSDPLFGVNQRVTVVALNNDGTQLGEPVHANATGEYVLAGLAQTGVRVQARCGGSVVEQQFTPSGAAASAVNAADLVIQNHSPKIVNMSAEIAGSPVTGVAAGSKVTLSLDARDDDGDPLQVTWAAPVGVGKLLFDTGNTVDWVASRAPGEDTIYALVSDRKGGYSLGAITLNVAEKQIALKTGDSSNWYSPTDAASLYPGCSNCGHGASSPLASAAVLPPGVPPTGTPPDFLTFKGLATQQDAINYYLTADPEGRRTFLDPSNPDPTQTHTLADWWNVVGFNPDGSGGVRTAYLNNNDLGFGRDMHCLQGTDEFGNITLACYVTNYGKPDQNIKNADLAWKAWNSNGTPSQSGRAKAIATVCMEYTVVDQDPSGIPVVKFFVYKGGDGTGNLLLSADLDGNGQKFVPTLCLNCHGGDFQPGSNSNVADLGASFREFDLASFRYSKLSGASRAKQETKFATQNFMVQSSNAAPAIQEIIENWYFANGNNGNRQNSNAVPSGWAAHPDLYLNVVAKSCRTCHIAQDSVSSNDSISWDTYDQFSGDRSTIQDYVCGQQKEMPHALITFKNFWLSKNPHSPDSLAKFQSLPEWPAFGSCR
jgi:hypothetical protein